ncbi:MAG: cytochrome b/b6 domain-containing protein [Hyphomonadaceae bacterium]|nr:cytochrome b/b6 domain-containing protein [Hyphomonadaceae bacterium]
MIWNSAYYWGIPAKVLHWVAAILVAVLFVHGNIWLDDWDERGLAGRGALAWHAAAGMTLAVVMLGRLLWRFVNRTPMMPAATPDWEKRAAHWAHAALYAVTFVVALTGWLSTAAVRPPMPSRVLWLFEIAAPAFDGGKLVRELHELAADMLIVLAAAHALAALWHHFVKRDSVLRRMLMRGRVRQR